MFPTDAPSDYSSSEPEDGLEYIRGSSLESSFSLLQPRATSGLRSDIMVTNQVDS